MNHKSSSSLIITALLLFALFKLGICREGRLLADDIREVPIVKGGEQEALARFAIEEHDKNEHSHLEFVRLVGVKEQAVDGKMLYLTFEANDAGKIKVYEAIVLVIPWKDNFKKVEVFKAIDDSSDGAPEQNPFNRVG
ncbi:hypothetical protein L6452_42163 [Arctium lappa]|uniref:Uncharacterized protein n=1 Tax=Arctium lappa TaxID=4217 RepID=A0ACB8XH17_ARCLA|nr:hypothetical protein L6452_42163 [Arctium lappa]